MQAKDSGGVELKKTILFLILSLFSLQGVSAASQKVPEKPSPKTSEERKRVDKTLLTQERGKPIQGEAIKGKLKTNSEKTLTKKLVTHPPKKFRSEPAYQGTEKVKQPLVAEGNKISRKPLTGDKKQISRQSRFKPDSITQPLNEATTYGTK